MRGGWVYIVTNRPNGTVHVGMTADIARPALEHRDGAVDGSPGVLVPRCHPGLVPGSRPPQCDPGGTLRFLGHSGPRNKSGVTRGEAEMVSLMGAEPALKS